MIVCFCDVIISDSLEPGINVVLYAKLGSILKISFIVLSFPLKYFDPFVILQFPRSFSPSETDKIVLTFMLFSNIATVYHKFYNLIFFLGFLYKNLFHESID